MKNIVRKKGLFFTNSEFNSIASKRAIIIAAGTETSV